MVDLAASTEPQPGSAALRRLVHARPDEVAQLVQELAGVVTDEERLQQVLDRVVALAVRLVPGCDAAGVTVSAGARPVTAAYSDERTLEIDRDQYASGQGPCLEAMRSGRLQRVDVGEAADRWPAFARAAAADGVVGFLAAPLPGPHGPTGALNLYARAPGAFDDVDEELVALLAGRAGDLVGAYLRYADADRLAGQLEEALRSRAGIEQAKGVLMARHGVDEVAAFDLLRAESQRLNVKLRTVARSVLEQAGRPGLADTEEGG
jgi:transcriptional regulator with GAF, ATPase, and Fis domain